MFKKLSKIHMEKFDKIEPHPKCFSVNFTQFLITFVSKLALAINLSNLINSLR